MSGQVRTHWHRLCELAANKENVYVMAPPGGMATHADELKAYDHDQLLAFLEACDTLPKFTIEDELMVMANTHGAVASLMDMKRAGVLRLPYPTMLVEYTNTKSPGHTVVMLRDRQYTDQPPPWSEKSVDVNQLTTELPFYGVAMQTCRDEDGWYMVVSPCTVFFTLTNRDNGVTHVHAQMAVVGFLDPKDAACLELCRQCEEKVVRVTSRAMMAAALVLATKGVEREVIVPTRLNRARQGKGKPLIPNHTYIYIGRVYRSGKSEQSDPYLPGRSPRPHWRRSHVQSYHTGPGKAGQRTGPLREHLIPARIVALPDDFTVEQEAAVPPPSYSVRK